MDILEELEKLAEKITPCKQCNNEGYELYKKACDEIKKHREAVLDTGELKKRIEMYKECFEEFIPPDKWDEASLFLSTYGSDLAKDMHRREL